MTIAAPSRRLSFPYVLSSADRTRETFVEDRPAHDWLDEFAAGFLATPVERIMCGEGSMMIANLQVICRFMRFWQHSFPQKTTTGLFVALVSPGVLLTARVVAALRRTSEPQVPRESPPS